MDQYQNLSQFFEDLNRGRISTLDYINEIINTYSNGVPRPITCVRNPIKSDETCYYRLGEFSMLSLEDKLKRKSANGWNNKCFNCNIYESILDSPRNTLKYSLKFNGKIYGAQRYDNVNLNSCLSSNVIKCNTVSKQVVCTTVANTNILLLKLDFFSNNVIINWAISEIPEAKGLEFINLILDAFVCSNVGFLIKENPRTIIKLPEVQFGDIPSVIYQVFMMCNILSKYNFIMGSVDPNNFLLIIGNSLCEYDGVKFFSNVKFKLDNLSDASINIFKPSNGQRNIRIHKAQNLGYLNKLISVGTISRGNITFFRIKSGINDIKYESEDYVTTLNIYSFVILLYSYSNFRNFIDSNDELRNIWMNLWLSVESTVRSITIDKIYDFLSRYHLRQDADTFIWGRLKNIKNDFFKY